MSAAPYTVISADSHAGPPARDFRPYFESKYHAAFDDYVGEKEAKQPPALSLPQAGDSLPHPSLQPGGNPGLWDPKVRLEAMDTQGIAGEVIFPDVPHIISHEPPFVVVTGGRKHAAGIASRGTEVYDLELQWAGARAYNRWLADLCSNAPMRFAGIAIMPLHDVEAAVEELGWAKRVGLRGGLLLPGMVPELPGYNDARYDPVWAACQDLEMPVNTHAGAELPDYGPGPDAFLLLNTEVMFFSHRPLWWLMWGGAFERHPKLRFVLTEQLADWVTQTLRDLERAYGMMAGAGMTGGLTLGPAEYWARQCYVGATFMSPQESAMRDEIGVGNIMWGSDYPHIEGSWPHTKASLRHAYAGLPEAEVRRMLGSTAAEVYHFDAGKLATVAERIGPRVDEVAEPLAERPTGYFGQAFR